jgi:tRNA(adenine34) deaminase
MWHTLSLPWQACLEEAWAAYAADSVPVGAVVVDGGGTIRGRGRNQITDQGDGNGLVRNHDLAHAELNALLSVDSAQIDSSFALYALLEPCPLCLGAFYMSRVRQLHYAARDPIGGSTNLLGTTPYLRFKPIRVFRAPAAALETLVAAMHTEFSIAVRGAIAEPYIEKWRDVMPEAVGLGEALFRSGALREMRRSGATVDQVIDELAKMTSSPSGDGKRSQQG